VLSNRPTDEIHGIHWNECFTKRSIWLVYLKCTSCVVNVSHLIIYWSFANWIPHNAETLFVHSLKKKSDNHFKIAKFSNYFEVQLVTLMLFVGSQKRGSKASSLSPMDVKTMWILELLTLSDQEIELHICRTASFCRNHSYKVHKEHQTLVTLHSLRRLWTPDHLR
jgi:hypothetical protein